VNLAVKPTPSDMVFPRLCRLASSLVLAATACMAGGCAGVGTVDVDVNAFASWPNGVPAAPGSGYRFDVLPSQQVSQVQRNQLETLTRNALSRKGFELRPATATYSVQSTVNSQFVPGTNGYGGTSIGIGTGVISGGGGGFSSAGIGFGFPLGGSGTSGDYRLEVVILIRSLQSNAVVYETHAYAQTNSGSDPQLLGALIDSALKDFPVPPTGMRRTTISLSP
jgi:Domain of unknown function (DUF4136)